MYLQYVDDYWVVISEYWFSGYNVGIYMRVKDLVLWLEYIIKMWLVYYNGVWSDMVDLRVFCWGVILMKNICVLWFCYSNVNCVYIFGNEIFCFCLLGYIGVICVIN